jgi:hypothetical protein
LIEQSTSQNLISRFSKDALAFAVDITLEWVTLLADIKRENKLKHTIMFAVYIFIYTTYICPPPLIFSFHLFPYSQDWQGILIRDDFYNKETIPEKKVLVLWTFF